MKQNIQISEIVTINTKDNRCALGFSFELLQHLNTKNKMLLLTANSEHLFKSNLEKVKEYLSDFSALHKKTDYLFLKRSWIDLYNLYGLNAFENELITITDDNDYDVYYFHRIDLFFDKHFTDEIKEVIINFIDAIRYHHKKVFFSYDTTTVSGKSFELLLKQRRDLSFDIILNDDEDCNLSMKTHNRLLKKECSNIVLISDNEDIKYLHNTILSNQENINYETIQIETLVDNDSIISEQTDLIIYNDNKKELNETLIKAFKQNAPYAQIFLLSNRKFIRKADLKQSQSMGIDQTFSKFFDVKEYVKDIEQVIQNSFYTQKLKTLSLKKEKQQVNVKELMLRIQNLEKNNIIYALITARRGDIDNTQLKEIIRKDDFFFIDEKDDIVLFVLLHILWEPAKEIVANRTNINKLLIKHHKPGTLAQLIN